MVAEIPLDRVQHFRLIVNSQNDRLGHGALTRSTRARRLGGDRQRDPELGSAGARLEFDISIVPTDEPPRNVEAKTGALTDRLGGEERIVNLLGDRSRNARPV